MGNSEKTWRRYYNLKGATRDGQNALQGMQEWREGMEALVVSTVVDVEEETADGLEADDNEVIIIN